MERYGLRLGAGVLVAFCCAAQALAEAPQAAENLAIELNTLSDEAGGCTLTFVVTNNHPVEIDQLVFETVLFDTTGKVTQLTLFDFGALPVNRPRVRQFAVPGAGCADIARILFNGVHTCTADGLSAATCEAGVRAVTQTAVEVLG